MTTCNSNEVDGLLDTRVKQVRVDLSQLSIEEVRILRNEIIFVSPALDLINEVIRGAINPEKKYLVHIPMELMS